MIPGYTLTIFLIFSFCIFFLAFFNRKYCRKKLITVNIFCLFSGLVQIWSLETLGNVPAWDFFDGTTLNIKFGKIYLEDVLFIPACTTLFYCFKYYINRIKDYLRDNYILHLFTIFGLIGVVQWLYSTGGTGARELIVVYSMLPLVIFLHLVDKWRLQLNYTAMYITLGFVCLVGFGWDLLNVTLLKHWFYNTDCNLLSQRGFFFNNLLHTSISIGYNIAGFIFFYSVDTIVGHFIHLKNKSIIHNNGKY